MLPLDTPCTAFFGSSCIAAGTLLDVAPAAKRVFDTQQHALQAAPVLVFNHLTGDTIELDWRGDDASFMQRLQANATDPAAANTDTGSELNPNSHPTIDDSEPTNAANKRSPGRPKLGVVPREVTLLPRHWDWLSTQPGGASVALRKLVEHAKRQNELADLQRNTLALTYRFMSIIASHEPQFEEASRALFALDFDRFDCLIQDWAPDVARYMHLRLAVLGYPAKPATTI